LRSLRTLLLILFFAGLAALEISHGLFRIETIRNDRRRELLGQVELGHAEQARQLRVALDQGRQDAAQLARLPFVATLLTDPGSRDQEPGRSLFSILAAVQHFSELTLFDPGGVARWSAGHGALEEGRARDADGAVADPALTRVAGSLAPGVVLRLRVYVTPVFEQGARVGFLVLTIDASPLQQALDFRPLEGTDTLLVDEHGLDATAEWPGPLPASLLAAASRRPTAVPAAAVAGPARTETKSATYVSLAVSEHPNQPLRLVTIVPESTLEAPLAGEYAWTVVLMVAITAVLVAAGFFILRLSERAFRLAESERTLRREQEVQRQLQTAEKLSSVGLLTAGVAHEINNPLEGIGNYLKLLEKEDLDPERRARYLDQVRHGFDRIRQIVAELLRFSRPSAERGRIDLCAVVERSVAMAAYGQQFKQIAVERMGLDQPLTVNGDAGRLEQVLLNLLLNAARAMDGHGRITITGSRTTDTAGARWIELAVEDEGTGIATADLDRLFDPFFSASGGTGLGLSVSYGIVKAHGGTLTAANRSERGARFTLRLPAQESPR
jgi:signal transduction histidine kinase